MQGVEAKKNPQTRATGAFEKAYCSLSQQATSPQEIFSPEAGASSSHALASESIFSLQIYLTHLAALKRAKDIPGYVYTWGFNLEKPIAPSRLTQAHILLLSYLSRQKSWLAIPISCANLRSLF